VKVDRFFGSTFSLKSLRGLQEWLKVVVAAVCHRQYIILLDDITDTSCLCEL